MRGDALLVGRVDIRVEKADRHSFDVGSAQLFGEPVERFLARVEKHGAFRSGALVDLEGQLAGDRRCRELDLQVVHVIAMLVADQ